VRYSRAHILGTLAHEGKYILTISMCSMWNLCSPWILCRSLKVTMRDACKSVSQGLNLQTIQHVLVLGVACEPLWTHVRASIQNTSSGPWKLSPSYMLMWKLFYLFIYSATFFYTGRVCACHCVFSNSSSWCSAL